MAERDVLVCDVGPRDGLQIDDRVLPPGVRAELCGRLAGAGVGRVEAVSFVNPKLVPTMAGAEEVVAGLPVGGETVWTALVLNERGYDRAIAAGLGHVNYTLAVTDAFCRRNQGRTRDEAEAAAYRILRRGHEDGITITFTLAVSFGCPFEGRVSVAATLGLAERLASAGPAEIVFADTIGVAVPFAVSQVFVEAGTFGPAVGAHFHDTRATGVANCVAAFEAGCRLFDASIGGTGGCPFAPGASGNVATEDAVYLFEEMGFRTGIDLELLRGCSAWLGECLGHAMPGAVTRAGGFPQPIGPG